MTSVYVCVHRSTIAALALRMLASELRANADFLAVSACRGEAARALDGLEDSLDWDDDSPWRRLNAEERHDLLVQSGEARRQAMLCRANTALSAEEVIGWAERWARLDPNGARLEKIFAVFDADDSRGAQ